MVFVVGCLYFGLAFEAWNYFFFKTHTQLINQPLPSKQFAKLFNERDA